MMKQGNELKSSGLLIFILTAGVFGIINTEMGVIGILPLIAETFHVTVPQAGWTVSVFALVVAISAPITPLLFSGINRKKVMLLAMSLFVASNILLALGMIAGYGQNTMQYMITHAAPEAPDFANGLFLLSANLGTTVGAAVCGAFITAFDTRYSVFGSLLFLVVGIVFVALRMRAAAPEKQQLKMAIVTP